MGSAAKFAAECELAAKGLRRMPKDLRKALSTEVKDQVAVPLAGKVSSAARGPWGAVLGTATKARAGADPTIVVGGTRKVVSGGASPRQLIYGVEFGGGGRVRSVTRRKKRGGTVSYKRNVTAQFRSHHTPFVFPTIGSNVDWVLDQYATIVDGVLDG